MPIARKAHTRFKTFLAHTQEQQNAIITKEPSLTTNSNIIDTRNKEIVSGQQQSLINRTNGVQRHRHEAEGTLEMQKMLLQKLAKQENVVKRFALYMDTTISKAKM
jgi:hypothetical protein